jgi:hypothetical protein
MEETVALVAGQSKTMREQLTTIERQEDVMRGQLNAMKEQATLMRETVEETRKAFYMGERAYIGIIEMSVSNLSEDQIPVLNITWKNAGKTPAWHFRCIADLEFAEGMPGLKVYFMDDDFSDIRGSFLPANAERTVAYPQGQVRLDKEMFTELQMGTGRRLWANILAVYTDISGEVQWFNARAVWEPWERHFIEAFEYVETS